MAKRRTIQQREIDKKTNLNLNRWGNQVRFEAKENTRVDNDVLRPSINYQVKPDTVITFFQKKYGKFITPKNVQMPKNAGKNRPSPPYNALKIEIDKTISEAKAIYVKDMIDLLKSPILTQKK